MESEREVYATAISETDVRRWYRLLQARGSNQHVTTITLGKQRYYLNKKMIETHKDTFLWDIGQHMPQTITHDNVKCDRLGNPWTKELGLAKRALAIVIACGGYNLT